MPAEKLLQDRQGLMRMPIAFKHRHALVLTWENEPADDN